MSSGPRRRRRGRHAATVRPHPGVLPPCGWCPSALRGGGVSISCVRDRAGSSGAVASSGPQRASGGEAKADLRRGGLGRRPQGAAGGAAGLRALGAAGHGVGRPGEAGDRRGAVTSETQALAGRVLGGCSGSLGEGRGCPGALPALGDKAAHSSAAPAGRSVRGHEPDPLAETLVKVHHLMALVLPSGTWASEHSPSRTAWGFHGNMHLAHTKCSIKITCYYYALIVLQELESKQVPQAGEQSSGLPRDTHTLRPSLGSPRYAQSLCGRSWG